MKEGTSAQNTFRGVTGNVDSANNRVKSNIKQQAHKII